MHLRSCALYKVFRYTTPTRDRLSLPTNAIDYFALASQSVEMVAGTKTEVDRFTK